MNETGARLRHEVLRAKLRDLFARVSHFYLDDPAELEEDGKRRRLGSHAYRLLDEAISLMGIVEHLPVTGPMADAHRVASLVRADLHHLRSRFPSLVASTEPWMLVAYWDLARRQVRTALALVDRAVAGNKSGGSALPLPSRERRAEALALVESLREHVRGLHAVPLHDAHRAHHLAIKWSVTMGDPLYPDVPLRHRLLMRALWGRLSDAASFASDAEPIRRLWTDVERFAEASWVAQDPDHLDAPLHVAQTSSERCSREETQQVQSRFDTELSESVGDMKPRGSRSNTQRRGDFLVRAPQED